MLRLVVLPRDISYSPNELVLLLDREMFELCFGQPNLRQSEDSGVAGFGVTFFFSFSGQISCRLDMLHVDEPFPLKSHCVW